MIFINNVSLNFSGVKAISNLNITIPSDGVTGIIGPNGAGKSTLFNLITGIYKPVKGDIFFEDTCLSQLTTENIMALGIARTFQNTRLLSQLSILENLYLCCAYERRGTFFSSMFNLSKNRNLQTKIHERANQLLNLFGLSEYKNQYPYSLSYGNQRKLEIARALIRNPKVLLLDEPAAGMNETEKKQLAEIVFKISNMGVKVVVIEHDMKFVMGLCREIFVLSQGTLLAAGDPASIQNHKEVIDIYLGKPQQIEAEVPCLI
jgi:branched-chain amino acid transport system ATP-binding protein